MGEVTLTGWLIVPTERLATVRAALGEHIRLTRAEPGCMSFDVTESPDRPGRFRVAERFATAKDFQAHQTRAAQTRWAEVTQGLERDYTITGLPR